MLLVIKVGSALLSNKKRQLDIPHLKHIVKQISELYKEGHQIILVTSGAVNAGRGLVNFEKEKRRYVRRQMYAALGQATLIRNYYKAFGQNGILAAEALITRENFADRGEHNSLVNMLQSLLNHNIIPILNENDAVANTQVNFGGNDLLSGLIAASIKADRLIILTDVEHLYNKDPETHKDATPVCEVQEITAEVEKYCSTAKTSRSMGGMITKIKAAKIATECGIPTYFANGLHKNILKMIVAEEERGRTACIGTYFKPQKKKHTQLKYWLKHCSLPTGTVVIDNGAVEALKEHKSLLLPGIKAFTDSFNKCDTVLITNQQNDAIGTGKINYSSAELHHAIALGKKLRMKPIIHCNNISLN
jgi:glutamate 5-kinase